MTGILAGRAALVTGASSGIGAACGLALAAAGAQVALSARRGDRLAALVARIEAAGGTALALPGDIVEAGVASRAVETVLARFGRIDILVNSAGIIQAGGIERGDLADYRRVVDVNLMATVQTCRAAIPPMRTQGGGTIVNISSQAARKATAVFNAYSASKHALNAMTEALRQEVGGYGIRVCALMPGATTTEIADNIGDPAFRQAMQAHVAKDGAIAASEIADAVLFVAAMPAHVTIDLLSIRPTSDTAP